MSERSQATRAVGWVIYIQTTSLGLSTKCTYYVLRIDSIASIAHLEMAECEHCFFTATQPPSSESLMVYGHEAPSA